MTWNINDSCGHESSKIAPLCVPYLQGHFLDLGCGDAPVWPSGIGVDNYATLSGTTGIKADISKLSMFADESMDGVFSSHALEDFERSKVPDVLKEWWRVVRVGGHLVLYLPHRDHYPHIGEEGCNKAHKWEPHPDIIIDIMKMIGSWTLLENEVRTQANEYSFFQVFQKDE
jgi:predicted SAM-dependent methyltransferase